MGNSEGDRQLLEAAKAGDVDTVKVRQFDCCRKKLTSNKKSRSVWVVLKSLEIEKLKIKFHCTLTGLKQSQI